MGEFDFAHVRETINCSAQGMTANRPLTLVDLGCNQGLWSRQWAATFLHAFPEHPLNVFALDVSERMCELTRRNLKGLVNQSTVIQAGLHYDSSEPEVDFYVDHANPSSTSAVQRSGAAAVERVRVLTISELQNRILSAYPGSDFVIKSDVEGLDLPLMEGLEAPTLARCLAITFEFSKPFQLDRLGRLLSDWSNLGLSQFRIIYRDGRISKRVESGEVLGLLTGRVRSSSCDLLCYRLPE